MLRESITLFIPLRRIGDDQLKRHLDTVTKEAGGVTEVVGRGEWFDNDHVRHNDHLLLRTHWCVNVHDQELKACVQDVVLRLHELGEKSVAIRVQRDHPVHGQSNTLYFYLPEDQVTW